MKTRSAFNDSSIDNVLLETNPDFTSHFLNSSTFMNVIWWTHCFMTVKPLIDWLFGTRGLDRQSLVKYFHSF